MPSDEFRLTVQSPEFLKVTGPSGVPIGRLNLKPNDLREQTIKVFSRWLSEDKPSDRELMVVLGSHLYELLFAGDVNDAFKYYYENRTPGKSLRVVLEFNRAADRLAVFPWEFIYVPDFKWGSNQQGFFLAVGADLILTRHVSGTTNKERTPEQPPSKKRIAIIVCSPKDANIVDSTVIDSICELADKYPDQLEMIDASSGVDAQGHPRKDSKRFALLNPSPEEFRQFVTDEKPNVVHFVGHGKYNTKTNEGLVTFVNKERKAETISDQKFADFLAAAKPQLVFLHACEGAKSSNYRGFRGLALALVTKGIPNVVAMQYEVENDVAKAFAAAFYEGLGKGEYIDEAVQRGRAALGTSLGGPQNFNDRRFGSPVVYVQEGEGLLLVKVQKKKEEQTKKPDAGPREEMTQCPMCYKMIPNSVAWCRNCEKDVKRCLNLECKHLVGREEPKCQWCKSSTTETKALPQAATVKVDQESITSMETEPAPKLPAKTRETSKRVGKSSRALMLESRTQEDD